MVENNDLEPIISNNFFGHVLCFGMLELRGVYSLGQNVNGRCVLSEFYGTLRQTVGGLDQKNKWGAYYQE